MTISPDQFAETVRRRHEMNSPFTADEVEGMTDEQYQIVLNDVAQLQRGDPEHSMVDAQHALGGGLYGHSLEHIGDLTHRMGERSATTGRYDPSLAHSKVTSQLATLTHGYGYDREVDEQLASNTRYARKSNPDAPAITRETVAEAARPYVLAHSRLPVYNEPMHHARAAAIQHGLQNTGKTIEHLTALEKFTGNPERYSQGMSREGAVEWLRSQEPQKEDAAVSFIFGS